MGLAAGDLGSGGDMNDKLLSEKEAAKFLGLTPGALRTRRARPGKNPIPYVKVGASVRYSEQALRRYVEQNTHGEK
jgi:hypothetical protein